MNVLFLLEISWVSDHLGASLRDPWPALGVCQGEEPQGKR